MAMADTWREMFEPAKFPPPKLSGLALAWRYGLALGFYLLIVGSFAAVSLIPTEEQQPPFRLPIGLVVADFVLGLVSMGIIHLRRRWPLATFLLVDAFGILSSSGAVTSLWAYLSLCTRRDLRRIIPAIGCSVLFSLVQNALPWRYQGVTPEVEPTSQLEMFVLASVGMLLMTLWGLYLGVRRDRAAAFQARVELADRDREFAVLAERNRIAREMHDVLAHRISLVSMHAGVLAYRKDLPPEKVHEVAQIIQENAHASLTELRSVLSSLREAPDAGAAPAAPQPTLADLPELIEDARRAGQQVHVQSDLVDSAVPSVLARHVFRVVQEGLTNARKHAPGMPVGVLLAGNPRDGVRVRVANPLVGANQGIPGARLGIIGVTERAQMMGGWLRARQQGDEFVMEAWFPWAK